MLASSERGLYIGSRAQPVVLIVLIQQLSSAQKKHTPDPTANKCFKETHDLCASLVPV